MKWLFRSALIITIFLACLTVSPMVANCETIGARSMSPRIGTVELPGLPIDDIGLSAYANIGQLTSMDFARITSSFDADSIDQGADYVAGSMYLFNAYRTTVTVNVYVNLNGWIVSYLEKSIHVSRIILWGAETGYNALEKAIEMTLDSMPEISSSAIQKEIQYYDFEYPEANAIMLIKDWADDTGTKVKGLYTITIPSDVILYDASVCLSHSDPDSGSATGSLYFNNNLIISDTASYDWTRYEAISTSQIQPDTPYLIQTADYDDGYTKSALVFIYKK